ncbi:hypothetical protein AC739_12500 [Planococcus glaciei]|uniref:flagellar hook-length control protein FliK n=1 Tax=Planococcus glaciei TaxID=459472 RepID=UPI00069FB8E5|nr:flagellar hook-length control protein FliK [Planococcus glaciei]KOF09907.1 hypothetical protein AC739_12500 [Planococcus glaciei]
MNLIDALKMAFLSPVNQTTKASLKNAEDVPTNLEPGAFSQLLAAAAIEADEPVAKPAAETDAKLLEILKGLQQSETEAEQLGVLPAILEGLSSQLQLLEAALRKLGLAKPAEEPDQVQAPIVHSSVTLTESLPVDEKTLLLLKQIQHKVEQMPVGSLKLDGAIEPAAINTKTMPSNPEQLVKQLTLIIQGLENAGAMETKASASLQSEKVEQLTKQLAQLPQDFESRTMAVETPKVNTLQAENVRLAQPAAGIHSVEPAVLEMQQTAQKTETVEPQASSISASAEGAKTGQAVQAVRAESQTPIVRLASLPEDLGGVLRGSVRLTGNGETAQFKVSIFPEHLGHLDIRLTTVEGKVAAHIFTSSLVAKEAIEMQLNQLRTTMLQQGVNLERIEITQQSPQQSFGEQAANPDPRFAQQQKQGNFTANKNGYQRMEEEPAAAAGHSLTTDVSMMKVDYTI